MSTFSHIFSRISNLRIQIGWLQLFKLSISRLSTKFTDPHSIPSYSQFGEDRVIDSFFGPLEKGIYVDIGCNHPISYSNTWKLYLKGWFGLCVDANPYLINKYKKIRPKDIAVQKVISKEDGIVDFYSSRISHLISGVGQKTNGHWQRTIDNCDVITCESVSLSSLLSEHKIPHYFELLTIDVEGLELEVLQSMNLKIYRPHLIVIEIHEFDLSNPNSNPIYMELLSKGYYLYSYLKPSGFFSLRNPNG